MCKTLVPARLAKCEESLEQVHVRILTADAWIHDLTLGKAANCVLPMRLNRSKQLFRTVEPIRPLKRASGGPESEKHEGLIIEVGACIDRSCLLVQPMDEKAVVSLCVPKQHFDRF